ncbi:uncharacterized protein TNCV_2469881 [Trichonephila clavipes]|nr:uncharacterized protein TNCV_2469881 [Trichonephila clavipes]
MDSLVLNRLSLSDSRLRYGFSGVYSSDKLPKQRKRYRSFIVNTDPAHFKGRHWQAIYFRQDNHCFFLFIWNTTSNVVLRKDISDKRIVYFKILNNSEIVQYIHNDAQEECFGFCQLHRTDPNDKFKVFSPNKHLFVNLLDCVLEARDITSDEDRKKLKRGFVEEEEEEYPNRKGVFPYSYFSNPEILNETCLPPKAAFFNNLSSTPVKDEDYDFALLVFRTFKCKKFADYLQLYQQLDVILLAEVFTSFRQKCLQFYKLDPCHFITAADLTWNAGLKYTKVELELFSDINMYLWIENSIRGGICFVGKRYALANNPFIPGFNKHEEESYIIAVDANNLYGYAMSQPLPIGHFFWLTKDEIVRVHYFVREFVGYRSRASSKASLPHLPVDELDSSGGQTGVALHLQDARVGVRSTKTSRC